MDGRDMAHWMREAEDRGYEIGFFSETIELMRDSVSSLSAIALATERITIGCTQIVRLRSPLVFVPATEQKAALRAVRALRGSPRLESARPWWAAGIGGEGVGVLMSVAVVRGRVDEIVLRRDPVLTGPPDGNGTGQPM